MDYGIKVTAIPLDLTSAQATTELLAQLQEAGIGIATLINNAGFGAYGPFGQRDPELYRQMIDLNIGVLTELSAALLPAMKLASKTKENQAPNPPLGIMNVASTAAFQPGPLMAVYFASKSYVLSFTEALHEELKDTRILISTFCPGPTKTEFFMAKSMIPQGPISDADRAEFKRRDEKRMNSARAAKIGYAGFLAGEAIVIPGARNRIMSQASRFLPRANIRKIVKRMLAK